jgi:transposase
MRPRCGSAPRNRDRVAEKYLLVACTALYTHYLLGDRDLDTFTASVLADIHGTDTVIVHDRYRVYDSLELGEFVHQLCTQHLLRDLDGAGEVHPDALWPTQIADALRERIHEANLARDTGRDRVDADVQAALTQRFRD